MVLRAMLLERRTRREAASLSSFLPAEYKDLGPHKFGCLMVILPEALRKEITDWTLANVPDFHLDGDGRELKPHVTIKYGFRNSDPDTVASLRATLAKQPPIEMTLKGLSLFTGGKDGSVLKMDVISPTLHRLNAAITEAFPCENKYPEYVPHLTLAYLKPEVAENYVSLPAPFVGRKVTVDLLEWSGADDRREDIRLSILPSLKRFCKSADFTEQEHPRDEGGKFAESAQAPSVKPSKVGKQSVSERMAADPKKAVTAARSNHVEWAGIDEGERSARVDALAKAPAKDLVKLHREMESAYVKTENEQRSFTNAGLKERADELQERLDELGAVMEAAEQALDKGHGLEMNEDGRWAKKGLKTFRKSGDFKEGEHPRDEGGKFAESAQAPSVKPSEISGGGEVEIDKSKLTFESLEESAKREYPKAKKKVDGREVLPNVDNVGSIKASLDDYEVLPGIREIKLEHFQNIRERRQAGKGEVEKRASADDERRVEELADKIKTSGKISPLIIVDDGHPDGPYVLEGGHRLDALERLGAESLPAKVVLDWDSIVNYARSGKLTRRLVSDAKSLSYLSETSGGALVPPAKQGKPIKLRRSTLGVKALKPPKMKASYFATCERDDAGHCLPSGEAGKEAGDDDRMPASSSDGTKTEKAQAVASEKESQIAGLPEEHGFIIAADGNFIEVHGGKSSLDLSDEEEKKCKDAVFTHNHPGGQSLSVGDFYAASRLDEAEIRAVGVRGDEIVTHAIKRPKGGWPKWNMMEVEHDVSMEALAKTDELFNAGKFSTKKDARIFLSDEMARLLAEKLGIDYQVTKRPKPKNQDAKSLKAPKLKESYFSSCERDDAGHCKPAGGSGESTPQEKEPTTERPSKLPATLQEAEQQALAKAETIFKRFKDVPKKLVNLGISKASALYAKMEGKYGRGWARTIVAVGIVTFPTPFTMGAVGATIGMAHLSVKLFGRAAKSYVIGDYYRSMWRRKGWVTLEPSGVHVLIEDGKITEGPGDLKGRDATELKKKPKAPKTRPSKIGVKSGEKQSVSNEELNGMKPDYSHIKNPTERKALEQAVADYMQAGFEHVNDSLRSGGQADWQKGSERQWIERLTRAFDETGYQLEKDLVVYRTMSHEVEVGKNSTDRGFISTTADPEVAKQYAKESGGKAYKIIVPADTLVMAPLGSGHAKEVILQRGSTFRVEKQI